MARSYEEAQQLWAAKKFADEAKWNKNISVEEGDTFSVENTVIYGGSCETCAYETAGYRITNNRTQKSIEVEDSFGDISREIFAYAEEDK